jgi:hypothetical protein
MYELKNRADCLPSFLYYPTLVYAYLAQKGKVPTSATGEEGEAGESAPLLGE